MSRNKLLRVGLFLLVPAGLLAWYVWSRPPAPVPPEIALDTAAPEVAQAIRTATEAVGRAPRSGAAWGELSLLLVAHGYHQHALECLSTAERLDRGEPRWPYLQGAVLLLQAKARDGIPHLRRALAVARTPDERHAVLFLLAQTLVEDGQLDEAEEYLRTLRQIDGDSPEVHFGLGMLAAARDDRAAARAHLSTLVDNPNARKQVCSLLAGLARDDAPLARHYRDRASQLPPDVPWSNIFDADVRRHRVAVVGQLDGYETLLAAGRRTEALDELRRVAEEFPSEQACFLLGFSLIRTGEYEKAEVAFAKVIGFNARHMKAHLFRGAALLELGERRILDPNGVEPAHKLFQQSVDEEDRALLLQPDVALAHLVRGRALGRLGRAEESLSALREAVLVGPDSPEAHRALGEALLRMNRKPEAITHLRDALRLVPEDEATRKLLAEAETLPPP